uniref:Uncharacterized protein n=1 Tax=Oryza glumipatula TaxID=40148 RepID=A0A0E0BGS8_9ORYZ
MVPKMTTPSWSPAFDVLHLEKAAIRVFGKRFDVLHREKAAISVALWPPSIHGSRRLPRRRWARDVGEGAEGPKDAAQCKKEAGDEDYIKRICTISPRQNKKNVNEPLARWLGCSVERPPPAFERRSMRNRSTRG